MSDIAGLCRGCEWSLENDDRNWQVEEDKVFIPKSVEGPEEESEKQIYIYA